MAARRAGFARATTAGATGPIAASSAADSSAPSPGVVPEDLPLPQVAQLNERVIARDRHPAWRAALEDRAVSDVHHGSQSQEITGEQVERERMELGRRR